MAEQLMSRVNPEISGELQVDALTLNPLVHFPRVAITLGNARLYEEKSPDSLTQPIFSLEDFHVSVNVLDLMQSKIEITEVSLSNGQLDLVRQEDGKFNLGKILEPPKKEVPTRTEKASGTNSQTPSVKNEKPSQPALKKNKPEVKETPQPIEIRIDEFDIDSLEIFMFNELSGLKQHVHLVHGEGDFSFADHLIEGDCEMKFLLDKLNFSKDMDLENEELFLSLDVKYNQDSGKLNIYQSDLVFRKAHLFTTGTILVNEDLPMDLAFEIADDELQFTKLFLTAEGIDNLKSGGLFLNGTAKGSLNDSIPNIECSFGANNLTVEVPKTGDYVRNFKFNGSFRSGTSADFSEAILKLDALSANLPTGYVKASSVIRNFKKPKIKYDLDAQFRLENLTRIFDLAPIQNLQGRINLKDQFSGSVTEEMVADDITEDHITITMDSLSFEIPEIIKVDLLEGSITGTIDSLMVEDLQIRTEYSDLLLSGVVSELSNFAFNTDTIVAVDLNIKSDIFNFPELFKALPKTAEAFPYVIRDISIDVGVETSKQKLEDFWRVPEIDFDIREVAASVDSLLDYVRLRDGKFKMYEVDRSYFLDFNDFKLLTDGNTSEAGFQFIEREGKRDSMNLALNTEGINLFQLIRKGEDSLPGFTDAWLSGQYQGTIVMPYDNEANQLIHQAVLEVDNFNYIAKDTISAKEFNFITQTVAYEGETTEKILATLDTENELHFGELKTSFFQADSLSLIVNTNDGVFSVSPSFHDKVGEEEEGTIYINFSEDPPKFSLDYTINKLPLEDFVETFYSEELLKGDVDLKLDLDATGLDAESITSSLSGSIYVVGDSLMLKGLNLDDVIKDFQRSQSFNLVDLGAVALAGPAGIVYSKGSSYVSLLTVDKNDSTLISKFSSKWLLDSGKISVDDVAFATLKNRVAVQGWLDMKADSLDMTIGVINEKGCAIFDQRVYGSNEDPDYSKVKFLKTLLAPVTNVIKGAVGAKCDVFYNGTVNHPVEPKKKKG